MTCDPDVDLFPTALHESGHAVMAAAFAADIRFVTIVPDDVFRGSCAWVRPRLECGGGLGADWPEMVCEVAGVAAAFRLALPDDDPEAWIDDPLQPYDGWLADVESEIKAAVRETHRAQQTGTLVDDRLLYDLELASRRALDAADGDPAVATQILLRAATRSTTELFLRWDVVELVADRLLEARTLSGDEVWALIEGSEAQLPRLRRPA